MSPTAEITLSQFVLNAAVKPFRPLTAAQRRVADLLARGLGYKQIGHRLNMKTATVKHHVQDIAALLPDDDLPARERVQIWALCAEIQRQNAQPLRVPA